MKTSILCFIAVVVALFACLAISSTQAALQVARYRDVFFLNNLEQTQTNNTVAKLRFEHSATNLGICTAFVRYFDSFGVEQLDYYQVATDASPSSYYVFSFYNLIPATLPFRPEIMVRCTSGAVSSRRGKFIYQLGSPTLEFAADTTTPDSENDVLAKGLYQTMIKFDPVTPPLPNAFYGTITLTLNSTNRMLLYCNYYEYYHHGNCSLVF